MRVRMYVRLQMCRKNASRKHYIKEVFLILTPNGILIIFKWTKSLSKVGTFVML